MPEGGGLALAIDNADAGMPHINPAGFCSPLRKVIFAAPLRATRQRAQWPRPLHSGPVRQIVPPLRGTFVHSRDLDGPAAIRSCSTRPLAASLRLALVTLIHSAARMPPPVTCTGYR